MTPRNISSSTSTASQHATTKKRGRLSQVEKDYIATHYHNTSRKDMAKALNREYNTVSQYCYVSNYIPYTAGRHDGWKPYDRQYIYEHYPTEETADIAAHLGRTIDAVRTYASKFGILKTYSFVSQKMRDINMSKVRHARPIVVCDLDNNEIERFVCTKDFALKYGFPQSSVATALRRHTHRYKDYLLYYVEDYHLYFEL